MNESSADMKNNLLSLAFILAALAVALGAFGAHGLQQLIDEKSMNTYQAGVQYHFYHAIGLAIAGLLKQHRNHKYIDYAGRLFLLGILLFSGSLYAMSFFKAAGIFSMSWLGAVTPFGGISFIAGWILLCLSAIGFNQR